MDARRGPDGRSTDIASGGGVPAWVAATLNHCSRCGSELVYGPLQGEHRHRLVCPSCGHIAYVNPRLVATTLPVTPTGEVVLIRRGIEPAVGAWAQPGGFLEVDETVHEAAVRETLEETGLVVEPAELIGLYSRLEAIVVVAVFEARIVGGVAAPTAEATEIRAFAPDAIPWDGIGFKTTYFGARRLARPTTTRPPPRGATGVAPLGGLTLPGPRRPIGAARPAPDWIDQAVSRGGVRVAVDPVDVSHGQALDRRPMIAIEAAPTPIRPSVATHDARSSVGALAITGRHRRRASPRTAPRPRPRSQRPPPTSVGRAAPTR